MLSTSASTGTSSLLSIWIPRATSAADSALGVETTQSIYKFGTYTVRAKEEEEALQLIEDAKLLERLGCFAIVLEKIPASLAQQVAENLRIPVIGIGAGGGVDGQVLVLHDMLGMIQEFHPRFLRRYMSLHEEMTSAINQYIVDVKSSDFPSENEQY